MYYVLQNLEAFYVVDPSMTKLGEFRTFEEAEDFCGYLNEQFIAGNQPDINFTNRNNPQQFYPNQEPQANLNPMSQPIFVNQEPQTLMSQYGNQPYRGFSLPNAFANPGVSYGNITINCNGAGTAQPVKEVQTVERVQTRPVVEAKPQLVVEQKPQVVVEEKPELETEPEVVVVKPQAINFLKDESLSSSNSLDSLTNLGTSSLNRGVGLLNKFNENLEETMKKQMPRYDEVTNSWITPTEINEFVQKLEQ